MQPAALQLGRAMLAASERFAEEMRTPAMYLHVAVGLCTLNQVYP
jgi:hypothetical protein